MNRIHITLAADQEEYESSMDTDFLPSSDSSSSSGSSSSSDSSDSLENDTASSQDTINLEDEVQPNDATNDISDDIVLVGQQPPTTILLNDSDPAPSVSSPSLRKDNTEQLSQSDSYDTCIICTEPMTNSEPHHIVTLKCGHLFGKNCLENWFRIQSSRKRCPQCNSAAKKGDMIKIYSNSIRPIDTLERDTALEKVKDYRNIILN